MNCKETELERNSGFLQFITVKRLELCPNSLYSEIKIVTVCRHFRICIINSRVAFQILFF